MHIYSGATDRLYVEQITRTSKR